MPNGTIGDHPVTDIIVHAKPTWSPRADRLVCEIVELGGQEQLERAVDIWHPPVCDVLESTLQAIRDHLRHEASARGWEVGPDTPPNTIGRASVVLWTPVDRRHRATGACRHEVAGEVLEPATGLAICQYPGEGSYFLFYCDRAWQALTDTWHETIEGAKKQAEFEYSGTYATWEPPA